MDIVPTIFVIFGGTGDLTSRKLVPSLFDLHQDGRMPKQFAIVAVGRRPFGDAKLRQRFLEGVKRFSRRGKVKSRDWNDFAAHVTYQQGDYGDPTATPTSKRDARSWKMIGKRKPPAFFTWPPRRFCLE